MQGKDSQSQSLLKLRSTLRLDHLSPSSYLISTQAIETYHQIIQHIGPQGPFFSREMFDPSANDMVPPPSSPTISSVSSSDLDTESTGSFFHDRSTTLGTLMGVNFPTITFRTPSHSHPRVDSSAGRIGAAHGGRNSGRRTAPSSARKNKKRQVVAAERRTRWWSLCRDDDDDDDDDAKPGSLGEYLEVERRFGDGAAFYGTGAELEGVMSAGTRTSTANGNPLFSDGRVLPPVTQVEQSPSTAAVLCRFPLTGICTGGD